MKKIILIAAMLSITATAAAASNDLIIAYGDAESHLNISKRVIDSLTPGLAQLGGVWLPLPHLLMIPFVWIDPLWRSGIAGSIVSGLAYIASCLGIYLLIELITKDKIASWFGFLAFAFNPNVLYMQSTPMTEPTLLAFSIFSIYFFIRFLLQKNNLTLLIFAAFFAFAASLSRYDGWFLVAAETGILCLYYLLNRKERPAYEGKIVLFTTLAGFGVALWLLWDMLILKDPFYFKNSPFSANSQQKGWLARGELPTYKDLPLSLAYYSLTSLTNIGYIIGVVSIIGFLAFINGKHQHRFEIALLLFTPFIFYVVTLYIGQSVIFIPSLTPRTFEWNLFNVRYGIMMVPFAAVMAAILISSRNRFIQTAAFVLIALQAVSFITGRERIISLDDGTTGLSAAKHPQAEAWLAANYDHGIVLLDDYARTISVIHTPIPMNKVIYIGNRPYWEESLNEPEKYARWIVMQKGDTVWTRIYENPDQLNRLYAHFQKVYTSPEILIFKRGDVTASN